jgi:predicted O-methyltransferase YrrM
VLTGDAARLLLAEGPFELIFADCWVREPAAFAELVGHLRPGGRIVMDDLTPVAALPAGSEFAGRDVKRELFAGEPRLTWTEVVLPDLSNSLLVGTRQ